MSETKSLAAESFTFTRGGPLHLLLARLGLAGDERQFVVRRALVAVLISWVPLFVLTLVQGQAWGHGLKIPFLWDLAVNVRFLIALPILILAESGIDQGWRLLVLHFLMSKLVAEADVSKFEALLDQARRLKDRVVPELLLLATAFSPSIFIVKTELLMSEISNWHTTGTGAGALSLAGWWFNFISMPLFRFLLLRWIWRLFLATLLLWRVTRLKLNLVATHTDMAAGLGFLTMGQKAFRPIVFAGGTVVASQIANAIVYQGATLKSMTFPMIAYAVLAIILLVAPLLVVTPVLLKIKKKALLEFGALVTDHNQQFDQKWIQNKQLPHEVILGSNDPCSLIDLGSSFLVVRQMAIVPIDKPTLLSLALAAALPMVPVALLAVPMDELIQFALKILT